MGRLLTLICTLTVLVCYGQQPTAISIKRIKEKYYLTKTCYDFLEWDEVVLKNKGAEKSINSSIRAAVKRYKLSKEDASPRCSGEMDYEPEFKIVYAKHGVISYELTAYTYFKGGAHGGRQFQNMNFNTATGKQISFPELIDSNAIAAVDSLIIQKLKKEVEKLDDVSLDFFKEQLPRLLFAFTDKGIDINLVGDSYWLSVVGVSFTYDELRPFSNKRSIIGRFYGRSK